MVNSISNGYGAGAISVLNTSLNGAKPGEFKPKTNAVTNIQTTLGNSDFQATQQVIFSSALNRLEGIRQGIVQPNPDREWEVVGAYLAATGQPFKLQIDQSGQLNVQAQAESSLSEYSEAQQLGILNAIQSFDKIAQQVDLQETKEGFLGKFSEAQTKLVLLEQHFPAEAQWEKDFKLYKEMGVPVQIGLNSTGEIVALNQLEHDFSDIENVDDRLKLIQARNDLQNILDGNKSATEGWHYTVLGNKSDNSDYLLGLDSDGNIEIRNNLHRSTPSSNRTLAHIIPSFLKEETPLGATAQWQEDAAALYRAKKPFYFDFDQSGTNIVAQQIDLTHAMGLHKPVDRSDLIIQAQLSILV